VVGDINQLGEANLFHLLLSGDGEERKVRFRASDIDLDSDWIKGAAVKHVGETKFTGTATQTNWRKDDCGLR
jgi:hypothetical protein